MATTTSKAQSVLVALRDQLRLRSGLVDTALFALPVKAEDLGREYVVLATAINAEQEYPFTRTTTKHETFGLVGVLGVTRPGAGEAVALATMERASEILGEIEACVREDPQISGTAFVAALVEFSHTPGVNDIGRYHEIAFTIQVQTRLVSS